MSTTPSLSEEHKIVVLLIDDQAMIGEAVRRMLCDEPDIEFHYCSDPTHAVDTANEIQPTVILQDLVMPELDGLMLVRFFRANPPTAQVPLIVLSTREEPETKAEAFSLGANDYMVKLPDKLEVLARIRYHSSGYIAMLQRDEAYKLLNDELDKASKYVQNLLPKELDGDPIRTQWQFIPSVQLGGDSFGYHWLDEDHFVFFLLDVSGHGVGSALLSVSAMNILRSGMLQDVDFRCPGEVLIGLNRAFRMEDQNNLFFTIWYGVFHKPTRNVRYACGGHHATIMMTGDDDARELIDLGQAEGMPIGVWDSDDFSEGQATLPPDVKLYLFSDGVFEIQLPDGEFWDEEEFSKLIAAPPQPEVRDVDRLLSAVRTVQGRDEFNDDFSLLEIHFE